MYEENKIAQTTQSTTKQSKFSFDSVRVTDYISIGAIFLSGYVWYNLSSEIVALNERIIHLVKDIKTINKNTKILDLQLTQHLLSDKKQKSFTTLNSSQDETYNKILQRIEELENRIIFLESKNVNDSNDIDDELKNL